MPQSAGSTEDRSYLYVPDLTSTKHRSRPEDDKVRSPSNGKIRSMIDKFESRDETPSSTVRKADYSTSQQELVSLEQRATDDANEKEFDRRETKIQSSVSITAITEEDSPFKETLDSLTQGKTVTEQNELLRGLVLDLMHEVDTAHLELQQLHKELKQRDQLVHDLQDESNMMREEHQCKLLSMAQALSEVDQQQIVLDLMKQLQSDVVVPGSAVNGMVIQQLTSKVEELELQNAVLKDKLADGKDASKIQTKSRWRRRRQDANDE